MIIGLVKYWIKKMNQEELEQFMHSYFHKMSFKLKEKIILQYSNIVLQQKGIDNYIVKIERLKDNKQHGCCYPKNKTNINSESIILNKTYVHYSDLFEILGTIYHECKHAEQNNFLELSKSNELYYQNEYAKKLDYCKNKTCIDINFCGINLKEVSLHIRTSHITEEFYKKSNIFYHLNISEREAFEDDYKYNKNDNIQNYINNFNKIYRCNLNKEEVFRIIDQCYENLVEHKLPPHNEEGNLIATIMYDMCLVSGYNSGVLSKEETMQLSTLKEKQKQLAKYDYLVYGVKYDGNLFSLEKQDEFVKNPILLKDLTKTEQNTNHVMIWKVLHNNKDRPLEYFNELLKDKDTFFQQIVGNDFSKEMCSELLTDLFEEEFKRYLNNDLKIER